MGTARLFLAGVAALGTLMTAALADDNITGTITGINRLNGTIAIQQTQSGTVGGGSGGSVRQFKVKDVGMMESVHAGDRVTFSTTGGEGSETITTLKKQ
jgi:Cu/Ag efflux protein CusF